MKTLNEWLVFIAGSLTAMVGYTIHGSIFWSLVDFFFWSLVDFFFWPLALVKWMFYGEINLTVIRETFGFLLK